MVSAVPHWTFGPFALDSANACLWRGTQAVALPPKAFDVLHYLVTHPDRLVTKDELLDAVWPETAVTDAVVRVAIGALRKALHDTAPPRFIATVPRRGYRFIAPVTVADAAAHPAVGPVPQAGLPPVPPPLLVGRAAVLQRLGAAWAQARQGQRQVVWVTGEAGMGKTAVVEAFRAAVATDPAVWQATGQCVEHYGTGEAYLPVLEALGQLCKGAGGERLVTLLRQHAPTWLVQLPWLLTLADREQLRDEVQGVTRERMLRECAEVIEVLTAATPLVLVFEDLHWSDYATLDLLALLARRRTPARLLVLGTYRPVETIVHHHPLRTVAQDLQRHGHATEIPLALLDAEAVAAYLVARFPRQQFPATLAPWLHQRTDGQPLFLVTLIQALVEREVLYTHEGCWTVQEGLEARALEVPETLRQLLEHQMTRLPPEGQRVLEVASVAGVEFVAAVVAAGLEAEAAVVEEHCEALVRQQWLCPLGVTTWPDGTPAVQYAFTHGVYQQVVYQQMSAGRRVRLHQRLGACLEAAYGAQVGAIAAAVAEHFVRGQDVRRAVRYLHQAAENAAHRAAPHEVTLLLTRALALLRELPETPERLQQELTLHVLLGPAWMATKGYAAPEVEQTYTRARTLCAQVGETPQHFPVLRGLCQFYRNRGAFPAAREVGEQLVQWAQREAAPTRWLESHEELGATLYHLGEFPAAWTHLAQGLALTAPVGQPAQVLREDVAPGVRCLVYAALTRWCLGYPTQAVQHSQAALTLARALAHPPSLVLVEHFVAWLHYYRRNVTALQAQAEALRTGAAVHGFPLWAGFGTCWDAWALAMQGRGEAGLAQLHQGMAAVVATGQGGSRSAHLLLLAETAAHAGQVKEGLRYLSEALAAFAATGRGNLLAEAYRLQGTLLLNQSLPDVPQGEDCFQQALAIARRQQAKAWELRAATSLSRLWQLQGKHTEAYELLAPIYGWFTEGFDTADLQEAKALLEELAG